MNKVTGLWVMNNFSDIIEVCDKNCIKYQEWASDTYDYELRINIFDLNQEQIELLKEYLDRNDIDEYTYITLWS